MNAKHGKIVDVQVEQLGEKILWNNTNKFHKCNNLAFNIITSRDIFSNGNFYIHSSFYCKCKCFSPFYTPYTVANLWRVSFVRSARYMLNMVVTILHPYNLFCSLNISIMGLIQEHILRLCSATVQQEVLTLNRQF